MKLLQGILIPVIADSVLSPQVYYSESCTGIYFVTDDDRYGRITFEGLDAIKVCRGEVLPYKYDWSSHKQGVWVFKVDNSNWLQERFEYEKTHYEFSYEFNGNVHEMLTDYSHYLFSFHDQFVEVISKGFWFEQSENNLFGKPLQEGHPFLSLPTNNSEKIIVENLTTEVYFNPKPIEELSKNARFVPKN